MSSFCPGGMVPIVMISESLLLRATARDGRILRDRVLSGFGVRLNARKRTFLIATSVCGKQFRMMLGQWPLMSMEDATGKALAVLRECRSGEARETATGRNNSDRFSSHAKVFHRIRASTARNLALSVAFLASRLTFVALPLSSPLLSLPAPGFLRRTPTFGSVFLA